MSRHNERIRRLVTWMRQHADMRMPLLAFHGGESIPDTPQEEIETAQAEGRRVLRVHFVKPGLPVTGALPGTDGENDEAAQTGY
jgi:hypothetical protein